MIRIFSQYVSHKTILLVLIEGVFIILGLVGGARLRFWGNFAEFESFVQAPDFMFQALIFVVTLQVCFYYSDLYDLRALRARRDQLICVGQSLGAASLLLGLMYFIFPSLLIGRGVFFFSTALVATLVFVTRAALDRAWQVAALAQKILILGSDELAHIAARELMQRGDLNVDVVGFLEPVQVNQAREVRESGRPSDRPVSGSREGLETAVRQHHNGGVGFLEMVEDNPAPEVHANGRPSDRRVLGTMEDLEKVVRQHQVSRIVVAMEDRRGVLPIRDLVKLRVQGIRVEDVHTTVSALSGRIWLNMVRPSWFIFSDGFHRSRITLVFKRIIDLTLGLLGLIVSSPIMLLVAIAVRVDSKGEVIFTQTRIGLRGKSFEVLKFRSMRADAESEAGAQWAQKNDCRVTRVGRYLRKYRLDELPQFINVIRGDMSFVGPRPERPVFVDELRKIISYYDERHSVRPGLTGWAQVEFTYGASIEDAFRKLEYDLFYLKNMSVFFDGVIILKTIRIILAGHGGR